MTKAALILEAKRVQAEADQYKLAAQNAVNLANYFAFNLETIEKLIANSPIGKGKLFKTFLFIVSNWKEIRTLLEGIVNQVNEWRKKIEEIKSQGQPQLGNETAAN